MPGDRQDGAVDLDGGFTTATVRRRGSTLSRTAHPRSEQVHGVLRHLAVTVPGVCPEPIAIDPGSGLEVVSFVEGEVPSGGASPEYLWSESTLTDVARLLRRIHDATIGVGDAADGSWRSAAPESWPVEVVCHNDVAPWNTVFRGARPVAFIDWDTAAPGPRIWDVAYALWHFVPLYGGPGSDPFRPMRWVPEAGESGSSATPTASDVATSS